MGEDIVIRKYKPVEDNCANETFNCDSCFRNGQCLDQGIDGRPRWEDEQ